jgi:hypothetical protein
METFFAPVAKPEVVNENALLVLALNYSPEWMRPI